MATWNEITEADPRIGRIAEAAEQVVAAGDEHRDHPDAVYTTAKRYLGTLVGVSRGREVTARPGDRADLERTFAPIIAQPEPVTDDRVRRLLAGSPAYQVVCTHLHDRLCELYDRRHRRFT